jgi:hypothetical protein
VTTLRFPDIKRKSRQISNLLLPSPLPLCSCYRIYFLLPPSRCLGKWMLSWVQVITTICRGQNTAKKEERYAKLKHALKIKICIFTIANSRSCASRNADFSRCGWIIAPPPLPLRQVYAHSSWCRVMLSTWLISDQDIIIREVPISRPTNATCDWFLFSIYMCITLHVSCVKRSSSGVPHRTYSLRFLCLCLSAALSCKKQFLTRQCRRQTQTQKLEAVCTVRDSWWWALDARNM